MFEQFYLLVILVPFFEELVFRYFLRRTGFIALIFKENFWRKYYKWFFYSSVISFGLVHILNYDIDTIWIILFAPFIVLSQIIGGAIMSYLRVRFNFWMGFSYHALWNFVLIFGVNFLDHSEFKEFKVKRNDYELTVKQSSTYNLEQKTILYSNSLDSVYQLETNNFPLKDVIHILDSTNLKYKPLVNNVDVFLKTDKGIPTDTLISILIKESFIEENSQAN